jgi:hypothetical protein
MELELRIPKYSSSEWDEGALVHSTCMAECGLFLSLLS